MQNKQNKSILRQWGLPFFLLIITIMILLINFSVTARKQGQQRVEKRLEDDTKQYSTMIRDELNLMTQTGLTVASVLDSLESENTIIISDFTKSVCNNSVAYQVIYADKNGKGTDQNGNRVDISKEPYFDASLKEQKYGYINADCVSGKSAIVSMIPTDSFSNHERVLYLYYPTERFRKLFRSAAYIEDSFFALALDQGKIVESVGNNIEFRDSDNLYNVLFGESAEGEDVQEIWHMIQESKSGHYVLKCQNRDMYLTFAPIKINNYYMIVGMNNDRVQRLVKSEWKSMRQVVLQLLVTIFLFFAFFIGINIVNRRNYNRQNKSLEQKADTDLLTELYNKIATEREIKEYINANPQKKAIFFLIDIDNFKKINDSMGHAFGDEVLRTIGTRLKVEFRKSDIIGRVGGDEMVLFLKNIPDDSILQKEIERVANFYQNIEVGEYVKYKVTASIGTAIYPEQGTDFHSLYTEADRALYRAKKRGKNCLESILNEKAEEKQT